MKRWEEQGRGKVEASRQEEKHHFLLKEVEKGRAVQVKHFVRALFMDVASNWYKCSDGLG